MKLSTDILAAFNEQITLEFSASAVYRQLAIEVDVQDLPGMASWLRHQADEEIVHANKFIDHVIDRDSHPQIGTVKAPAVGKNPNPLAVFEAALKHEQLVSEAIRTLYRTCDAAGDLDAKPLLDWFINEQIEEESTVGEIVGRLKLIGADGPGLLRLDAELATRPAKGTEDGAN